MHIEIRQPELEALIQQRLDTGRYDDVEDVLIEALKSTPTAAEQPPAKQNLADFLLNSPLRGADLKIERLKDVPIPIEL